MPSRGDQVVPSAGGPASGHAWDRRAVDRLATADGRTHRSWTRGTAVVMATVVHLVVLALLAGGLGLLLLGDNLVQRILGVVVLVPAVPLLRTGRVRPDITLDPQTAPVFTALVAELAEGLGTRPPTMIGFNEDYNAYAARVGLRTRLLVIGAPLWAALSPQGRVALLGHELGHFSGRDVVHGRYVWRAYQTLRSWVALSTPAYVEADGRSPLAASLVTWPLRFRVDHAPDGARLGQLRGLPPPGAARRHCCGRPRRDTSRHRDARGPDDQ